MSSFCDFVQHDLANEQTGPAAFPLLLILPTFKDKFDDEVPDFEFFLVPSSSRLDAAAVDSSS